MSEESQVRTTPFYQMHVDAGAKMVPFAGYEMPVSYPLGIKKEHAHTRQFAGLFDVSHMGQIKLTLIRDNLQVCLMSLTWDKLNYRVKML